MTTDNFHLVTLNTSHLHHIMGWVNDPEVMGYFAGHQNRIGELEELQYIQNLITSKNDMVFSAFDGDTYVGQVAINQIHWPSDIGRLFLCVTRDQQRKGYGPAMVTAVLKYAKNVGLHKVWLMVREDNHKAQAMYARAGFAFEGVLRDEYKVRERYLNMVRMGRILE